MMEEEWRDIKGYEGRYLISDKGSVKSIIKKVYKVLKPSKNCHGYLYVILTNSEGLNKCKKIHRLVAENFLKNEFNKYTVNHKNGNKEDNTISNLEWNTQTENSIHSFKTGLNVSGSEHHFSKLKKEDVILIRKLWEKGNITQKQLAIKFNVKQPLISRIVNFIIWKHI